MKAILLLLFPLTLQAQIAVKAIGPNTNGIDIKFPIELREGVGTNIPPGFHTNLTPNQLRTLYNNTRAGMDAYLAAQRDAEEAKRLALLADIQESLAEIKASVTNFDNLSQSNQIQVLKRYLILKFKEDKLLGKD